MWNDLKDGLIATVILIGAMALLTYTVLWAFSQV